MKIIVTGASGFLGSMLVPRLAKRGIQLLLVGRNSESLRAQFPGHTCCGYDDLARLARGYDLLVNLAVRNSDAGGTPEEFANANVDLPLRLAEMAATAGVQRFVNVSSLHALDPAREHPYAVSKRKAAEALCAVTDLDIVTVYLPAVHGERWAGRWSFLNSWQGVARQAAVAVLSAFKPVVHVDRFADYLIDAARGGPIELRTILADGQDSSPFYQGVKRLVDLLAALTIAVFFWWLLLIIWLSVWMQSPGPGIFAQTRVGRHGVPFTCYKFRTMQVGTRQAATHEVSGNDVTWIGRFLRRSKLDELPQIFNLLKGEMTLVGPRPCLPVQTVLIEARRGLGVLDLVPGITGLSQVNGLDMSDPTRLAKQDHDYKKLQCLSLDGRIMIFTALGAGRGDRVAR